jgi:hypothetical protein
MSTSSLSTRGARFLAGFIKVLQLLMGGALGVGIACWAISASRPPYLGSMVLALLWLGLAFVLTIAIHEGGHWVGSRYAGLQCLTVAVLWLYLERPARRWQLRLKKSRPGSLGHVTAIPRGFERLRQRMALFIAAGPAASLLVGLLALALGWVLRQPYQGGLAPGRTAGYLGAELLFLVGAGSVFIGVLNLLPFTMAQGNLSDGERLRRLRRPGPAADQEVNRWHLATLAHQGLRPRDWPSELLARLLTTPGAPAQLCEAHIYNYAHHLDRADMAAARHYLHAAYAGSAASSPAVRRSLACELAYLAVVHDNQPAQAAQRYQEAQQLLPFKDNEACFIQALVACDAGDWAAARRLLPVCELEARKVTSAGMRAQGLDRIQELHALVRQRSKPVAETPD